MRMIPLQVKGPWFRTSPNSDRPHFAPAGDAKPESRGCGSTVVIVPSGPPQSEITPTNAVFTLNLYSTPFSTPSAHITGQCLNTQSLNLPLGIGLRFRHPNRLSAYTLRMHSR